MTRVICHRLSSLLKRLSPNRSSRKSLYLDRTVMSDIADRAMTIGTHNGTFHCDEVLACVLLKLLPRYKDATIVRSRDPDTLDKCDVVVDVGGVYDPSAHRYDHHMRNFCQTASTVLDEPSYNNEIKLSSAGLIYCHFGHEVLRILLPEVKHDGITQIFRKIYDTLIVEIDAIDNGLLMCESAPSYSICTDLSSQVKRLNLHWNSTNMNEEEQFRKAMSLVLRVFMDFVTHAEKVWLPAREIVRNAVNNRLMVDSSGQIIELSEPVPWQEHMFRQERETKLSPSIKFVIFSSKDDHRVQCVPLRLGDFNCRIHLPDEWCGLRDDALVAACGIDDAIFVHTTGFIGGHKTRDGTLAMARRALEIGKRNEHHDPCE